MKAKKIVCLATAAVMTASIAAFFAGCGDKGDKVLVTWYDGTTELKHEEIDKGSTVPEYTPTKDGWIFLEWYADSSKSVKWDPKTTIDEDVDLFASWGSAVVEQDNRMWYILGAGVGDLMENNYTFATEPERTPVEPVLDENDEPVLDETTGEPLTTGGEVIKDANGYANFSVKEGMSKYLLTKAEGKNEYSITVTLYKGAAFQMATNLTESNWTGDAGAARVGFGNMTGAEYITTTTGQVLDEDENVIFTGKKGFDDTWLKWDITSNINAKYTFTLHTYPGEDAERNFIDWKIEENLGEIEVENEFYLKGTFNNFGQEEDYKLEADVTGTTFVGYLQVPAEGVHLKVHDAAQGSSAGWYTLGADYVDPDPEYTEDNSLLTEGFYKITAKVTADGVEISVEDLGDLEVYLVGTFEGANFSIVEGVTPKFELATATTMTATIDVTAVGEDYSWVGSDDNKNEAGDVAIYAIKPLGRKTVDDEPVLDWNMSNLGSGNFFLYEEGEYTITFNLVTGEVSAEKAEV